MISFKDLYEVIKELKSLAEQQKQKPMVELAVNIQSSFFDIREEMETLKAENVLLKEQLKEKTNLNAFEDDLELETAGWYIRKSEKSLGKQIRYCAVCWGKQRQLIPLVQAGMGRTLYCGSCKNIIQK